MTNGELLIQTIEDVMGIEFDRSFNWKEMKNDVLIAFDGSWWRKEHKMTKQSPYTAEEILEVVILVSSCTATELLLTPRQMEILNKLSGLNVNDARDILFPLFKMLEGENDELKAEGQ